MKVCFVHRHYPPWGRGGICTYLATLARGLVESGHTVHVIARAEKGSDRVETDRGVIVHRLVPLSSSRIANALLTGAGHWIRWRSGRFVNRLWAGRRIAEKLRELEEQEGLDVVETAEWEAELYWYLSRETERLPTIVKLHGPMEIIRQVNRMPADPDFDCLARWEKEMTLLADHVSSPSHHLAEEMGRRWGLDPESIEVIPYPVDAERFSPRPGGYEEGDPVVLYVGRFEKNKGTDVLISAIPKILEKVPEARFRLIGSDTTFSHGGMKTSFRQHLISVLPRASRSRVEWLEPRSHERLVEEYRKASVFVIPSLFDNFPNTCLEAMSCGCAIVGSDTGGIREMLGPGPCGVLSPPGCSETLAEGLIDLLKSPERRLTLGERARKRVLEEYALEKVLGKTVRYYERVIGAVAD